jgi:hypothetical protein
LFKSCCPHAKEALSEVLQSYLFSWYFLFFSSEAFGLLPSQTSTIIDHVASKAVLGKIQKDDYTQEL